jgi:hypothetical protein
MLLGSLFAGVVGGVPHVAIGDQNAASEQGDPGLAQNMSIVLSQRFFIGRKQTKI